MPIDKSQLYGTFEQSRRRRERLADLATRKALDLPLEDDVHIITTTTNHGVSWISIAMLVASLLGGGGAMFGLAGLLGGLRTPPAAKASAGAPAAPASPQEFKVTFWAEDGKPIEVQDETGKAAR